MEPLNDKELDTLKVVTNVYRQQKNHFKSGDSRESIPNRIVSVSKPYVRPVKKIAGVKVTQETITEPSARINSMEILLVFLGIHTANVVILARRDSIQVALAA